MCERCRQNSIDPRAPSRRTFMLAAAAVGLAFAGAAEAKEKAREEKEKKPPKPQNVLSPDAALEGLRRGNARYVEGVSLRHDFKHEREALTKGQNPYAAILSCADSRIAPEYAFDSGRGDLFVSVTVITPTSLTREQRRLLEQLANVENKDLEDKGLVDKVRDIFG